LIATPVIELKPDKTNALSIVLTYVTAATAIMGSERYITGLPGNKGSVRYQVTALQPGHGGEVIE
jgi:hypothetical protein